jgi:hypothetical protein
MSRKNKDEKLEATGQARMLLERPAEAGGWSNHLLLLEG